jgi:arylsulfatase A-like enzyme
MMPLVRTPTALATLILLGISGLTVSCTDPSDTKPAIWMDGDVSDIEALSTRDDLNVLFILVDTLRADRLSAYGYGRDTSPTLANLARLGVRFDRHMAQSSWTKASMASLWTSYNPTRTGVINFDDIIPEAATMPAEVLSQNGFRTVGLYRNGWVSPKFGFGQGFDVYTRPAPMKVDLEAFHANPTLQPRANDEDVVKSAIEFLRVDGGQPWFLYMHLMDVHEYTYDESSASFGGSYSDVYDNSILWTDTTLDLFLGTLLDRGFFGNTLIVITSDHGEAFRERGLEGHARFVFKETTEVPFILLFPFRLTGEPIVIESRTRNVDIWPTLYDLLGIEPPEGLADADGVSLVPEILAAARGEAAPRGAEEREGFAHLLRGWGKQEIQDPTYALATRHLRYVAIEGERGPVEQLFDSREDPSELNDLAPQRSDQLEKLRQRAADMANQEPAWGEPEARDLNELELNQLRALGYALPGDDGR